MREKFTHTHIHRKRVELRKKGIKSILCKIRKSLSLRKLSTSLRLPVEHPDKRTNERTHAVTWIPIHIRFSHTRYKTRS